MKKILCLVLSLAMVISLAACGGTTNETETTVATEAETKSAEETTEAKEAEVTTEAQIIAESEAIAEETDGLVIRDEYLIDKLTVGISGDASSLVPWGRAVFGNAEARNIIFQKLCREDTDGECRLELAKSIEKVDDLTYEVELWDCIHDSNGNQFTASDVLFSFQSFAATGMVNKINRIYTEDLTQAIEIVDDYNLIFHLQTPFEIGEMISQFSYPNMVVQKSYEASSDGMVTTPVGTGPYKVKEYVVGSSLVLEADEDFWMKDLDSDVRSQLWVYNYQNVKEIEYQAILDASSRAIALEMGTVDLIDSIDAIDMMNFETNPDISPIYMLNLPPVEFIFNCSEDSPCSDVNLRMAICYALNNEEIAAAIGNNAFEVFGFQSNLYDAPDDWTTGRDYYDYSEEKAAEYLGKTSYNGETLTIMYGTSSTGVSFEDAAIMIQAQLKKVGINVEISGVEQAVNEVNRFDSSAWDLRMDTWGGGNYCINVYSSFVTGAYSDATLGDRNIMLIKDEKLDSLYAAMTDAEDTITAFDDYFTYEKCYGYALCGYYLQTAERSTIAAAVGDRGTLIVPNATVPAE